MGSSFNRIIKSKRNIFIIFYLFLLTVMDIVLHLIPGISLGGNFAPAFAGILSASTEGHIAQILIFWFLPIYILMFNADHYIQDVHSGYNNIMIGKIGKKRYIFNLLRDAFVFPSLLMFTLLMINYLLCQALFFGGSFYSGLDTIPIPWLVFTMKNPNVTYFIFILSTSIVTGLCGLGCAGFSLIFPDYKMAYPLAFVLWFYGAGTKYSPLDLMTPFSEYGLETIIPSFIICLVIAFSIAGTAYVFKVKTDEI